MARHAARIAWERAGADFVDRRYPRGHLWAFDGGIQVPASASPDLVPPPMSLPGAVDPEEAFMAALASCHMLWFPAIAAGRRFVVDACHDEAIGEMGRTAEGRTAITRVLLRPVVRFGGETRPGEEECREMHHLAHQECYIANSVRTAVVCEGSIEH